MKLAIRILALCVVVAGGVAASSAPKSHSVMASHQSATAEMPIPACGPGVPTCPKGPGQ